MGATGWVEAMSVHAGRSKGHAHDEFWCKHAQEDWHIQVLALKKRAEKTPSAMLEEIFAKEIAGLLETRVATKKVYKNEHF